jgi:hypothetical protein
VIGNGEEKVEKGKTRREKEKNLRAVMITSPSRMCHETFGTYKL